MAGLGGRVPEGDRAARRSGGPRRRPADAFHVVCPSLPGYGFSDQPARRAGASSRSPVRGRRSWTGSATSRYGAQGGDWGAAVTTALGRADAAHWPASISTCAPCRPDLSQTELTDRELARRRWEEALPPTGRPATRSSSRPGRKRSVYGLVGLPGRPVRLDRREVLGVDRL